MVPGGAPGLQNQSSGSAPVRGEFDSHTLPPTNSRLPRFGGLFVIKSNWFSNYSQWYPQYKEICW